MFYLLLLIFLHVYFLTIVLIFSTFPGLPMTIQTIDIPFTKYVLDNGLTLIVHRDTKAPIVAVNVWYHVGSKNEQPGKTGFAHLFEHLMFEGSEHYDEGFFQPLQKIGAAINGSTNADRTNYWEVVPSTGLELALWMESDRMGFLLPALTTEKFLNQKQLHEIIKSIQYHNTVPKKNEIKKVIQLIMLICSE